MKDARILITGGTGSFGQAFARRILQENPKRLVIFSRGEHAQETMAREFQDPCLRFFIGDVRDDLRLAMAMRNVDIVIHAAALKVVPTCEYNPQEAIRTNVIGAENVIRAAIAVGVKKVVAISTDKAVAPANLYGATKLCGERLFLSAHNLAGDGGPLFSVIRYGNVLGSRGSVVPLFEDFAKRGLPLPITDERMTRFIITLPQAIEFVRNCLQTMKGNEIFVPKIPSIRIMVLAEAIQQKYKMMNSETEIVGIRPGEKIHEVLISADEAPNAVSLKNGFIINWQGRYPKGREILMGPYTSNTNSEWLSVEQFRDMI